MTNFGRGKPDSTSDAKLSKIKLKIGISFENDPSLNSTLFMNSTRSVVVARLFTS